MHSPQNSPPVNKWAVMAAVGVGIFLATIDGSIVNIALPTLVRELNTDFATIQWVVLAYLLTLATLLLGVGRLADMLGKKPIYTAGFAIFTLGSVLCGLSPTVGWLIAARVFQALGAAMVLALGPAIVTETFPPEERGKALGVSGGLVSLGIIAGPTLGGLIIGQFSWHWIFYVNLPVGLVGIWLVLRNVPAGQPSGSRQFDFGGAVSLLAGLLCLLLGLTWGQQVGFTSLPVVGLFTAAVIALSLFIWIERRHPHPMVDLGLFRDPLFSTGLASGLAIFVALAGVTLLTPFYLENVLGYETQEVGLLMSVLPVLLGISAPFSGALSDRFGTRTITLIGVAVLLLSYWGLTSLSEQTSALGYIIRFLPLGLGMGIFQSPNNSAIMGAAPRQRLGVVSGMLALTRTLGQTTGIAVMGAFWAWRVAAQAGEPLSGGATTAPAALQVLALRETFLAATILLALLLLLNLWAAFQAQKSAIARGADVR